MTFTRRLFLGQLAAAGLGSLSSYAAGLSQIYHDEQVKTAYLIKNAHVLSMDPAIGELEDADILIENDKIVAVGKKLAGKNAKIIDGTGMIALPGFVETHWHIWTSLMRAMTGEANGTDYFSMSIKYGKLFTPDNTYQSTRLALAEAIYSGITHVHDWSHNIISIDHAKASLRAIKESGIRGRFSVGVAAGQPDVNLTLLTQLNDEWASIVMMS